MIKLYDTINRPLITEKSTILSEMNKYTFVVDRRACKASVKNAVEKIFGVVVSKVNILNVKGKVKRFKGKLGKCADVKKAVVTIPAGYSIDITGVIK